MYPLFSAQALNRWSTVAFVSLFFFPRHISVVCSSTHWYTARINGSKPIDLISLHIIMIETFSEVKENIDEYVYPLSLSLSPERPITKKASAQFCSRSTHLSKMLVQDRSAYSVCIAGQHCSRFPCANERKEEEKRSEKMK